MTDDANCDPTASTSQMERPQRFAEKQFVRYLMHCMESKDYLEAERYLLESLEDLQSSNINRKEKLNSLHYMTRLLQRGGGSKHGQEKLQNKARGLHKKIGRFNPPTTGTFVDLGCGAHDPVALATYHFINGYDRVYSIDLLKPRNPVYSALSMYGILANALVFPDRYLLPWSDRDRLVERVRMFDLEALERGDFWAGLAPVSDRVRYERCDIVQSTIEPNSVGILASFAVLEHVDDIDGVCRKIFDAVKPGGIVYHFIDLADHRSYRLSGEFHALSFLGEEEAPANINRLRASQHVDAQRRAGFELLFEENVRVDIPAAIEENMRPQFAAMDPDDVRITKQHLVLRKPT